MLFYDKNKKLYIGSCSLIRLKLPDEILELQN